MASPQKVEISVIFYGFLAMQRMTPSTSLGSAAWMACESPMRLEHWAAIATARRTMIILIN